MLAGPSGLRRYTTVKPLITPVAAYPMYFNRTTSGCGPSNTGDVPRWGGPPAAAANWDVATTWDCACSSNL